MKELGKRGLGRKGRAMRTMKAMRAMRARRKTLSNISLLTFDRNSTPCQALQYINIIWLNRLNRFGALNGLLVDYRGQILKVLFLMCHFRACLSADVIHIRILLIHPVTKKNLDEWEM